MKHTFISTIQYIRARCVRFIKPYDSSRSPFHPLSTKFGFDRGTPIDRYWIESFIRKHIGDIHGNCLEVGDNYYTKTFGSDQVSTSEILDINTHNKKATIYGDMRNLLHIPDAMFDTIILTHVLGMLDQPEKAVHEMYRILKPNGVILATTSCLGPNPEGNKSFWRIMPDGANFLFSTFFDEKNVAIETYGNMYAGQAFLLGCSQEDISQESLELNDPMFPCIVGIRANKRI